MNESATAADLYYEVWTDETTASSLDHRQSILRLVWITFGYPLLAAGTAGHALLALACVSSGLLRDLPLRIFILVRSAWAILALYLDLLMWIVYYQTFAKVHFMSQTTELGCRLYAAVVEFLFQFGAWVEVGVALERAVAVRWPHLLSVCLSTRNCAVALLVAAAALLGLSVIPLIAHGYLDASCVVLDVHLYYRAWLHVHGLVRLALPSAAILACGATTLHALLRPPTKLADGAQQTKLVTALALSLNAIYLVTNLPAAVSEWRSTAPEGSDADEIVMCATLLFLYLGSALSFVVCVVAATKSRKLGEVLLPPLQLEPLATPDAAAPDALRA